MLNYKNEEVKEYDSTFNELIKNIDFYVDSFLKDGILILKNINCSELEQRQVQAEFGSILGFYPDKSDLFIEYFSSYNDEGFRYEEDHKLTINDHEMYPNISSDDIILKPHLECTHYAFPQVAAFWSMNTFSCKPNCGNTFFYDSRILFDKLKKETINFLRKSKITTNPSGDKSTNYLCGIHDAVGKHLNSLDEVIRVDYKGPEHIFLVEYENREPTEEEIELFKNEILLEVTHNIDDAMKDHDYWYKWSQGDLVIPDLSVMYHAVNGGFDIGERSFLGFWSFPGHEGSISQFSKDQVTNYVQELKS